MSSKNVNIWKKSAKYVLNIDGYKNLNDILQSENIIENNDNFMIVKNLYAINKTSLIYDDKLQIASNFLCSDTINNIKKRRHIIPDIMLYHDLMKCNTQKTLTINDLCLNLIRFQNCNYFHFLLETLPYLIYYVTIDNLYIKKPDFMVVVNDFCNIISSLLDVNIISNISKYDTVLFNNCIIPKNINMNYYICWNQGKINKNNDYYYYDVDKLIFTREFIFKKFGIRPDKKKNILIGRDNTLVRNNDVTILLKDINFLNYDRFYPNKENFYDQVYNFSQASIIIMEAGAAVANLLFAPKGCLVFIMSTNSNFCNTKLYDIFELASGVKIINIKCGELFSGEIFAKDINYYLKNNRGFVEHPYNLKFKVSSADVKIINTTIKEYNYKQIIIFGIGKISEVAYYFLKNDTLCNVVAFTVEKDFIKNETTKFNLPIIPFEELENKYNPNIYLLFAPCTGTNLNKFRERVYNTGKQKGYKFYTYISSKASVFTENIGENCFILEDNTIQPYTKIGNNCVLWSGNHIGHHSTIEDHVFITSHVVISGMCLIKKYCYLGVNASVRDNIILEEGSVIGMGSSVTRGTEGNAIYMGTPAKFYKKCDDMIVI